PCILLRIGVALMERDEANLRRLRQQARMRMEQDERDAAPVYGGPPVQQPVYGAPPPRRRKTLLYVLLALVAVIGGIAAWIFGGGPGPIHNAVYGGPPPVPGPPPAPTPPPK